MHMCGLLVLAQISESQRSRAPPSVELRSAEAACARVNVALPVRPLAMA